MASWGWDGDITFASVPREDFNRRWIEGRRGGGGGGDPIAKPLGVLMLMLATLALITRVTRQSNLNASLLAGNIFGYFLLNERPDTALSGELQKTLTEFGMTLVLFFAGLSIQLPDRYLSRVVPVSVWHTLIVAVLFAVIAFASGLCEGRVAVMLFGLTCALSSKTLVDEYLEESDQATTMHGRSAVCISWVLDIFLLIALSVVQGYKNSLAGMGSACSHAGNTTNVTSVTSANSSSLDCKRRAQDMAHFGPVWPAEYTSNLGDNIGVALATLVAVMFCHWTLKKYALQQVMRFLCTDGELLFCGVMAYSLGSSALCHQAGFSLGVSSYLAGFAISFLPSRIQVQQKIASLRAFGVFLFHFMLGVYVKIDPQFFTESFLWALLLSVVVLLVCPVILLVIGLHWGMRPRSAIYTGLLCNNVGEHALILASLSYQAGIFKFEVLQIIVVVAQLTMLSGALLHRRMPLLRGLIEGRLGHFTRPDEAEVQRRSAYFSSKANKGHIVICGFNETGLEIAQLYRQQGKDVVVVDLDWELHETFVRSYKGDAALMPLDIGSSPSPRFRMATSPPWSKPNSLSPNMSSIPTPSDVMPHVLSHQTMGTAFGNEDHTEFNEGVSNDRGPGGRGGGEVGGGAKRGGEVEAQVAKNGAVLELELQQSRAAGYSQYMQQSMYVDGGGREGASENVRVKETLPKLIPARPSRAALVRSVSRESARSMDSAQGAGDSTLDHNLDLDWDISPTLADNDPRIAYAGANSLVFVSNANPNHGMQEQALQSREARAGLHTSTLTQSKSNMSLMDFFTNLDASHEDLYMSPRPARRDRALEASYKHYVQGEKEERPFVVNGRIFGGGTNIFSIYEDPENERTWDQFHFKSAGLVVSCMGDNRPSDDLCEYMKDSDTPLIVLCTSNVEAKELYEQGADYVVQQDFLAAKELHAMLAVQWRESITDSNRFRDMQHIHQKELEEEERDYIMSSIGEFI